MMGWQWHQLDHNMQIICTSLQTDNHASTSPLSFLQAGCPSCRTKSVKALKAVSISVNEGIILMWEMTKLCPLCQYMLDTFDSK